MKNVELVKRKMAYFSFSYLNQKVGWYTIAHFSSFSRLTEKFITRLKYVANIAFKTYKYL